MNIEKKLISKNYTKGVAITPEYIVIHETDNTNKGADAEAHYMYFGTNDNAQASVHFVVDDKKVIQLLELNQKAWHVGDNKGHSSITNSNSIGIEICVNSDGNYFKARENAIGLVRHLIQTTGITADRVVRHYDASGKHCPRKMMDNPQLWTDFKKAINPNIPWYNDAQWWVKANGISDGTRPEEPATRAEMWQMLYSFSKLK